MTVRKFPPPPTLSREYQQLNRWLIEIQSILNAGGEIDASSVDGLVAAYATLAALAITVTANSASITTLNTEVGVLQGQVTTLNTEVGVLQGQVTTLNTEVAALQARNQILNGAGVPGAGTGNDGDLYLNNTGGAGSRLYGKIAGAWVMIA